MDCEFFNWFLKNCNYYITLREMYGGLNIAYDTLEPNHKLIILRLVKQRDASINYLKSINIQIEQVVIDLERSEFRFWKLKDTKPINIKLTEGELEFLTLKYGV